MIFDFLAFVEPPTQPTTAQWLDAAINIMDTSQSVGAKLYPLIMGIGILRIIFFSM